MVDFVKEHDILEKRITEAQKKLKKIKPDNPLLTLVEVNDIGIHYIAEFGKRYEGLTVYEGLKKYVAELEIANKK